MDADQKDIDCQEFHEIMMDYRAALPCHAQAAYETVLEFINNELNRD